jgi:hypothetical protein
MQASEASTCVERPTRIDGKARITSRQSLNPKGYDHSHECRFDIGIRASAPWADMLRRSAIGEPARTVALIQSATARPWKEAPVRRTVGMTEKRRRSPLRPKGTFGVAYP